MSILNLTTLFTDMFIKRKNRQEGGLVLTNAKWEGQLLSREDPICVGYIWFEVAGGVIQ